MAEIVWESDAQMSGFTLMDNGMVWPDDWPGTLVEAQFTSARGDGADLDRDPDMVPSGPGRVTFTPQVRTVGYDGERGKRIVSLHPFEAVVGDDGYLYTPDEYGQPGIRGIVLPSNDSAVVDEHDWTWRVTFDIPYTTIRPTDIPTPHDHSVDIKDYLDSDANYGVRVVVDRVAARETLTARDETIAARDLVLPARDQTLAARDETLQHGITVDTSVGTRVFVGDTMIHGDTGWRVMAAWDTDGNVTYGELPDDLEPLQGASGGIQIRRINSDVFFQIHSARTTRSARIDGTLLPTGYRVSSANQHYAMYSYASGVTATASIRTFGMYFGGAGEEYTNTYGATVRYFADTDWPTSLPGIPR